MHANILHGMPIYMAVVMDDEVSKSVVNDVSKPYTLKCHSKEAHDEKNQQHQQFVLGLDKKSIFENKNSGK